MTAKKRERLEYICAQNKAAALRSAMPSTLSLLKVVRSKNTLQVLVSLLFLAVDSTDSYTAYTDETEMQYLQDGWALDDEEAAYLHSSRKGMFSYMVRMVGEYDLPGNLTLNEASVEEFVKWKNQENIAQRIQFLEGNKETYQFLGDYWLLLAESYYFNGEPRKCLDAVNHYRTLNTNIFRKDYSLATVIPYAIVSAKQSMDPSGYLSFAEEYVNLLLENTDQKDWEMRFFAAQTYVELYALTQNRVFLQSAYDTILNATNHLVETQKQLNQEYLADVQEAEIPQDASREEKKEIKAYNEHLREVRKTALPPVYEPLRLCCDLLFGLAEELELSPAEQQKVDGILHYQGERIFLDKNLDNLYRFDLADHSFLPEDIAIDFDGDKFTIPAQYVSAISKIRMTVDGGEIADWQIKEVERNKAQAVEEFTAVFASQEAEDLEFDQGDLVIFEIFACEDDKDPMTATFEVEKKMILGVFASEDFVRR